MTWAEFWELFRSWEIVSIAVDHRGETQEVRLGLRRQSVEREGAEGKP